MINLPLLIVCAVFAAIYFFMVLYFFVGWVRLKKPVSQQIEESSLPFVSVIIPARNEAEGIINCLESILNQDYPGHLFEVAVINDYSTDGTFRLASSLKKSNLLVLDLKNYLGNPGEYTPNKKKAIALGIKNAKGELIVTTDGDCIVGKDWLKSMVSYYHETGCKMLTGPVMIKPARFPMEIFQQLDVITLSGITAATIRNGSPILSNGANLMYAKQTFLDVEGFKGNHDTPTGDDLFLMNKISQRYPGSIAYVKDFAAVAFTKPEGGLVDFFRQRIRWISKCTDFKRIGVTSTLYFAYLYNVLFIVAVCFTFPLSPFSWLPLAILGGAKVIMDLFFCIPMVFFFRKGWLLFAFPFVEVIHFVYVLLAGLLGLRGKYRWKDRLVK